MAQTPIITFPETAHERLITWSAERLLGVLRHYLQWITCIQKASKFSLLANLQQASRATISVIVEAAEKLELQSRGTITAFYCMKPYAKSRSRQLKKLLGLKPSKKHPKIPLFKVVLLKTHQDLFSQIDVSELTPEFGGTLIYDHAAWVRFHQTVTPCIREAENAIRRLPAIRDRVELLQEYEVSGQSAADIQTLMGELSDKYHLTVSEAHFQETLDGCKQTLLLLDHDANTHADWLSQVHADHVTQATSSVRQLFQQLDSQRWQLEETWRGSKTALLSFSRYRNTEKDPWSQMQTRIEKKIKTHFEPLLKEHPCVANTLSQAELYRTHFTTSLYEPAKELLGQATEILEDMQRLKARSPDPLVTSVTFTQRLTVTLQPFTQHLQGFQDVYVAVHIFHLLLEKALKWYRKVLKFLPDALLERLREVGGNQILQMPLEWQGAVESFLHRHPPPQEQHIAKLDTEVPPQVDRRLRLQARSLALRLRLLQRLLFGRRWPIKLLEAAFSWKSELHGNTMGSISSTKETKPTREHRAQEAVTSQLASDRGPSIFLHLKRSGSFSSTDTGDMDFFAGQRSPPVTFHLYGSSADEEKNAKEVNPNKAVKKSTCEPLQQPQVNLKTIPPTSRISNSNGEHLARDAQEQVNKKRVRGQAKVLEGVREQERFVRLTFSPSGTTEKRGRALNYKNKIDSSNEDFLLHDLEGNPTGSESGIEVLDVEDPCDTIVEKIKAVSSSSLPGEVKLQCVSHLLATSSFRQPEKRAVTLRDFRRARNADTSFRSQVVGRPRQKDGRLLSYRAGRDDERSLWVGRGHGDPSPLSDDAAGGQKYRQKSEATIKTRRLAEPEKLPLGERPASAVAKLRQRLARSLMDLDIADEDSIHTGHNTSDEGVFMTSGMKAKRFSYDPALAPSYQFRQIPSPELRRKSQDDILDLARSGQGHSAKMTFQRPLGDGSTLLPWLEDDIRPSRRKYFGSHGDLLDVAKSSLPKPSPVRLGTQKSPSRWRQNIVVDAPDLPSKGHQQARDFIAPSFLQPSTSLTNIGFNIDAAVSFAQSSHSSSDDIHPAASKLRDQDPEHAKTRRLETFSEQSYNASADSLLIRLSDEADMEYMSQNELESSLKRSHQILKATEEKLVRRQQSFDQETYTNQNPEVPLDTKDSESSGTESSEDSSVPPQILTSQDFDPDGEESASQWMHHTFDLMRSGDLKAELDWDADVSNMSDHWSEGRKRGQSFSGPDFF
ncbi:hypothetical protein C0Q70_04623 [Pomacea canaliculata]|uniref:CRAL-TRIO domain-containing protein n=1 Tax=Pomacea canaliculata TaxID=400727 RepID=A0A2T7PIX5_POMCA|nr:hypothetical protein C0Q70_04623 [Pomacea canaliculata]